MRVDNIRRRVTQRPSICLLRVTEPKTWSPQGKPRVKVWTCQEIWPGRLCRIHFENTRTGQTWLFFQYWQDQDDGRHDAALHNWNKPCVRCIYAPEKAVQESKACFLVEHRNLRAEEMLYKTTEERSECEKEDAPKNKGKRIGKRTPESCSKMPSSKARGYAGKFCAPMSTETHGILSIA